MPRFASYDGTGINYRVLGDGAPVVCLPGGPVGRRVLLYGGDRDPLVPPVMLEEAAPLFGDVPVAVQPGAGHFPWVDDPAVFAAAIGSFLD